MSLLYNAEPFTKASKRTAIDNVLANITPDFDFYVLLIGAALLAVGGIFLDSVPVLIASMIVAPLAYPILGLGLGIAALDIRLIVRSVALLAASCALAFALAIAVTFIFGSVRVNNIFISFAPNGWLATSIAVVAGGIATYGLVRPKVSSAITGVAIAVSLMPPLVATGIALASGKTTRAGEAFVLLLLNIGGILLASVITFLFLGVAREYRNRQK